MIERSHILRIRLRVAARALVTRALREDEKDVMLLVVDDAQEAALRAALLAFSGNQCAAARWLGIHRTTLRRYMLRYGIAR